MIPQRLFSNEFQGGGVRDRVSACRKRLRESRSATGSARVEVEKSLQTTAHNRPEVSAEEILLESEGQGVGIT
jgi:hypothetical protein